MSDTAPQILLPPASTLADPHDQVERMRELVDSLLTRNQQLQTALETRIVIEQAKGVLAERYRMGVDDAFDLLRRSARNHRLRVHALATAVVASHETPPEIPPPQAA